MNKKVTKRQISSTAGKEIRAVTIPELNNPIYSDVYKPSWHLCRGIISPPNECPGYDTKKSDCKATVMLELWGIWITFLLPSLLGLLWPEVVAPDRVIAMGLMELFDI